MKIEVTSRDIKRGQRMDSEACPVALAMRRKIKGAIVGVFCCAAGGRYVNFAKRVTNWILAFDNAQKVKPFAFNLDTKKLGLRKS